MGRALLLLLAASLTLGGVPAATYGEASPPPVSPTASQADKENEPEEKKSEAPPESGDDIEAHLEETQEGEAEDQPEEEPSGEEEVSPIQKVVKEEEQESGDHVGGSLEESREIKVALFEHGPIAELFRLWKPLRDRLSDDTGIQLGIAYTTLFQAATVGENPREGWSGDFDLFGKWILLNRNIPNTGSTGFLLEYRHRFTEITPNALNDSLGGLWGTTNGFNSQDLALAQLWWEQYLFDDHVKVVAGKIDATNYYNGNRFQSQNTSFLNQAFSSNPTRSFPDNGLGVNVRLAPSDKMYFSFGAHDANSSKTTSGFNNLDGDELFYAAEIALTPRVEKWGPGRYRLTGWHAGPGKRTNGKSGSGFALSFEQDFGNDLVPFFRYGYQDDELEATKQIVVGGLGVLNPLGWKDDILGVGFAWGEPADTASRDQYVMELYLRHQLTPKIKITPGFQLILDPSFNRDDDVIGIFEFRVRVVF